MPGPLPEKTARRRNAPTIPTTDLPAGGRPGRPPRLPKDVALGPKASAWWRWAWKTPQAAAWSTGDLHVVARRAQLEDDRSILEAGGLEDLGPMPTDPDDWLQYLRDLDAIFRRLQALARGSLSIAKEMRELDDRLGLTPKAREGLRWKVVPDQPADDSAEDDEITRRREERKARLAAGG